MRLPEKLSGAAAANSLLKPNFMRAAFFLSAMLRLFCRKLRPGSALKQNFPGGELCRSNIQKSILKQGVFRIKFSNILLMQNNIRILRLYYE